MALDGRHLGELDTALDAARRVGIEDWRRLDAEETRAELASPLYRGALLLPRAATVHPVKLARGLRDEARRLGVRFHERTAVTGWRRSGDGVRVVTAGGTIRARRAVLATNAWSRRLAPALARRFVPLYDYVVASAPLSRDQLLALGWRRRRAVTDCRAFFNYYRLTRDDRVIWGTSEALHYPGDLVAPSCDHSPRHYADLRAAFRRHFPQLGEIDFPFAWGGPICSTTRFTPFFGALAGGRVLYGLGYTGHGDRHDAARGTHPRPPRARAPERPARAGARPPATAPLSAGSRARLGDPPGHPRPAGARRGRRRELAPAPARPAGGRAVELKGCVSGRNGRSARRARPAPP